VPTPYTSDLPTLADPGCEGADQGVCTPVRQRKDGYEPDPDTQTL
jgi:hypothetical protein